MSGLISMHDASINHLDLNTTQVNASKRLGVVVSYVIAIVAYSLLFTFWQVEPVPLYVHMLSIVITATGLWPLVYWKLKGSSRLPIFEIFCLSYVAQFSMPIYTQPNGFVVFSVFIPFTWENLYSVLVIVELGLIAVILGYYWAGANSKLRILPHLALPMTAQQQSSYLFFAITIGGGMTLASRIGATFLNNEAIGAIIRLLSNQLLIGIVIFSYYIFAAPPKPFANRLIFYSVLVGAVALGLATGLIENALVPLVLVFVVRWHVTRQIPWRLVFVGLLAFFVLNSAKYQYRTLVWYGKNSYTLQQQLSLWKELSTQSLTNFVSPESGNNNERTIRQMLARFDLVHKFIHVYKMTPTTVPYYQGKTYAYFLAAWIPRVLWPNKPTATEWSDQMDFDFKLRPVGSHYSIGIGQLPEAYANFGIAGVVIVMFLQGAILATFNQSLNSVQSQGGKAIYLTQMVFFLNGIGSTSAILFGALLQQTIASAFIMRFFVSGFRADPEEKTLPHEQALKKPI